jgi:hypothetical protein
LGGTMILKTLSQILGMIVSLIKPTYGFDRSAGRLMCGHQTRANRITVHQDSTGTAITRIAPDFHVTHTKLFAQKTRQPRTGFWKRRDRSSI